MFGNNNKNYKINSNNIDNEYSNFRIIIINTVVLNFSQINDFATYAGMM